MVRLSFVAAIAGMQASLPGTGLVQSPGKFGANFAYF
jgi:hypothetical protein